MLCTFTREFDALRGGGCWLVMFAKLLIHMLTCVCALDWRRMKMWDWERKPETVVRRLETGDTFFRYFFAKVKNSGDVNRMYLYSVIFGSVIRELVFFHRVRFRIYERANRTIRCEFLSSRELSRSRTKMELPRDLSRLLFQELFCYQQQQQLQQQVWKNWLFCEYSSIQWCLRGSKLNFFPISCFALALSESTCIPNFHWSTCVNVLSGSRWNNYIYLNLLRNM